MPNSKRFACDNHMVTVCSRSGLRAAHSPVMQTPNDAGLERLAAWIRSHGFTATVTDTGVEVQIPWVGPTGDTGTAIEHVRTVSEARTALGY